MHKETVTGCCQSLDLVWNLQELKKNKVDHVRYGSCTQKTISKNSITLLVRYLLNKLYIEIDKIGTFLKYYVRF